MAHMFKQGFSVREPMWHRLGIVADDYPGSVELGMKLAGHDHTIIDTPLYMPAVKDNSAAQFEELLEKLKGSKENKEALTKLWNERQAVEPLNGWKALKRDDNNVVLNVVNKTYEIIQNNTPWELIDSLYTNGAKFDTAGVLHGHFDENGKESKGDTYWVMSLLDEPKKVKLDDSLTFPYLMATWGHGNYALKFRAMSIRVVCANTHHLAMVGSAGADLDISIKHFGNVEVRLEKAKEAILMARKSQETYLELANELSNIRVSDETLVKFIETLVPMPATGITERQRQNILDHRAMAMAMFDGHTITPAMRNTGYGMLEVGVEFLDHVRRWTKDQVYFSRNLLTTTKAKAHLVDTIKELALAV